MNPKLPHVFSLLAVTAAFFAISAFAAPREWTQAATGKKIMAEFVGMKDDGTANLKLANGAIAPVPLAALSEDDQAFINSQSAAPAEEKMADAGDAETPAAEAPEGAVTLTISKANICCRDCVERIENSLQVAIDEDGKDLDSVALEVSRSDGTIIVKAPDAKKTKTALAAITTAGVWGTTDNPAFEMPYKKGGDDLTTDVMNIKDVTFCCGSAVKDFEKALKRVDGVEETTAKEGGSGAKITGEGFTPAEVATALREAGFGGTWQ